MGGARRRIIANDEFFAVKHYAQPDLDPSDWRLSVDGLVEPPQQLTLDDLKARPRQEVTFTLECSGNTGLPFFIGGIGNAVWAGTPLAPLLDEARLRRRTHRGRLLGSGRWRGRGYGSGGARPRDGVTITEQFARSMALADATAADNLLVYEMNGAPLPAAHGCPVRLIAPGWYGVANVKWLTRIEVLDRATRASSWRATT